MKQFLKMLAASFLGVLVAMGLWLVLTFSIIGSLVSMADSELPDVPSSAILKIDLSKGISEQNEEETLNFDYMRSGVEMNTAHLGILNAVSAIDYAATDPAIKFIYISNCSFHAELSHLEEIRDALVRFHNAGKAIVAYGDNLSLGGWYLASVADKQYLHPMAMSEVTGISANMFFIKDLLSRIGVNVQLIRHGKYKSAGEMFVSNTISRENLEQNQVMVSSLWKTVSDAVTESRNLRSGELDEMVNTLHAGTSESMLAHGIIDGIVTRQEMNSNLCELFGVSDEKELKFVSLSDYAKARVKPNLKAKEKVAIIYADGEIAGGTGEDGIMSDNFRNIISKVREDKNVKAVVLRVNSPGGDAQAAEVIREELERLKSEKPLIASFGSYAASGGYWISAGADKIYSDHSTITGSIGVFGLIPEFSRLAKEKLHVNPVSVKSNTHADMFSLMRPFDQAETEYIGQQIEDVYERFVKIVSDGRGMTVEAVDSIGQGRVWTGADAKDIRLIDEFGGLTDAVSYAAVAAGLDSYRIVSYPVVKTQIEKIVAAFENTEDAAETMASLDRPEKLAEIWMERIRSSRGCFARLPYTYHFE